MDRIDLQKQVYGVLEDYGLFQEAKLKPWDREIRDNFFKAFLVIAQRYAEFHKHN